MNIWRSRWQATARAATALFEVKVIGAETKEQAKII